tara:strand:+ start:211 stop:1122 length:912 start_codon:yes stop_codon:yes gene_type:complete
MNVSALAIVIPYYKLRFFEATLESLANQTDHRFTLYIGDDASPEDVLPLLESYKKVMPLVYKRFQKNLGAKSLVRHWERCMKMMQGEPWLMIVGDDDILGPQVVAQFYKQLPEFLGKMDVIRFATQKIDCYGQVISKTYYHPILELSINILFNNNRSSLSEYVFRTAKVQNIRFKNFPLAWSSDILGVLEFSSFNNLYSINEAVVQVRYSDHSISGQQHPEQLLLKRKAKYLFYNYLLTKKASEFTETERKILLKKIQKTYSDDKKQLKRFFQISRLHIKTGYFKLYIKFLITIITTLYSKIK